MTVNLARDWVVLPNGALPATGLCPNLCRGVPLRAPRVARKEAPTEGRPYSLVKLEHYRARGISFPLTLRQESLSPAVLK
jgi:hypothetical protein